MFNEREIEGKNTNKQKNAIIYCHSCPKITAKDILSTCIVRTINSSIPHLANINTNTNTNSIYNKKQNGFHQLKIANNKTKRKEK